MVNMIGLGFTVNDIDEMEIGEMYDICITKSNMFSRTQKSQNEPKAHVRDATQADFDRL